ncbi:MULTISPECIES: putative holin [unclassified Serratia (in: enterobacteria)]|uniref:putative holin n=1 Tax=unclassified Serratia (in: enterobacteria) TaxID=2647522 RepID=UPI000500C032|nr:MULTISPECIES: putative holin [unclassified Serratia (in: enterobacteria)]KFK92770.1 membrane protein [Serratia sp. Ag2]KFK98562.1 membrane protein [Serratia sp. Ag1]
MKFLKTLLIPVTTLISHVKQLRLGGWLLTAVLLLVLIALVSPQQLPVVIYKLSLITLAAVLGYWLDCSLFPKSRPGQYLKHDPVLMAEGKYPVNPGDQRVFAAVLIRRALIVAAVCLSVAMGL